nr:putative reverse transcriptase domain-containing protein [Tanacetum cinerariifolium]
MSFASSAFTHTFVYTDSEPGRVFWGADEELSNGGSLRVIVYGYDGLPMQPVAPPSPDYIPGPKEPQTLPVPQDEDEREPMFIRHMILTTCQSLCTLNPEEDPKEYEDDETEDGPVDYPMDEGDDGNDDDDDSSGMTSTMRMKHVIPPPSTDTTTTRARITVQLQAAISLPPKAKVERFLAMPTLPPSPLTSLSPLSIGERLARMAFTQALIDAVTVVLPSPPLPPPLYIPPLVDRRDDIPETEMPPRKRLCFFTLGSRYETRESSTARPTVEIGYGIKDTWVDLAEAVHVIAPMTLGDVNTRVTELAELNEHDTQDLYALLEDAQDSVYIRVSAPGTPDTATIAGYSHSDTTQSYETRFQMQQAEIAELRETDRRCQAQMVKNLRVIGDMRREMGDIQIMAPLTRQGPNIPPNNTNPNNMTLDSVQAMIDQALLQNSTNEEGSHRTEGVVGLTRWIKKMESVFQISGYAIENQVKFATCTLLDATLTWWDSQIRSLGPDAYLMTWDVIKKKMTYRNSAPIQKGRLIRKGRLMIYPETTMVINNNPPRDRMSPRSTIWDQRNNKANPKGNGCFECGAPRHFKRDCPKLKNKDRGNVNAQGWVYVVGNAKKKGNALRDPNSNVITGTFLLNNRYASILFDTGADRSFISITFSSLIEIVLTPLGNSYDVELADGKIVG